MNEDPAYLQTVSLHLARVLDEIGLNQETVERRRRAYLLKEHTRTTSCCLTGLIASAFHFGSQTEGATTSGLESDLDQLTCFHDFNVIQDWAEWQHGKMNLMMLLEDTAPGYCRLQVLGRYLPTDQLVLDSSGRVILKNTILNKKCVGSVRNGPAQSLISDDLLDIDFVGAVKCESWPRPAVEFITRNRRHNWPTHTLLQQVIQQGCFLVPVGHTLSPTEHLEWRLSASLAERCLMFSLNIVHIKVYVLMKMLVKSFVEPGAGKCISSYHCKTALLYCTENTEAGFWVERNILQCVTRCLAMLISWVTEGFCPQFIIPDENLFAGKVTARNRLTLQLILRDFIISNGRAFLGVQIDDLGLKVQAKLSIAPSIIPILDSQATVLLIGHFEFDRHTTTSNAVNHICSHAKNTNPTTAIRYVYTNIEILKGRMRQLNKPKRQANEAIIELLYGWLGSLLASVSLSHKMRVPRVAIHLLRIGATYDIASMLKLASVLYSNGDYRKVETILQEVDNHFSRNLILSTCRCHDTPTITFKEFFHMMYVLRGRKSSAKLIAYCVIFTRQEIHCAPPTMRNEYFRSVGDDIQHRDPLQDQWMDMAVVDCLPYLHYLQYMTYRQLGKQDLQKQSLLNLERCIKEDDLFCHLETAWNLLGQCLELEQNMDAAVACYRTSVEIRPRNNAANWHVAILCYKVIKPHL